jgi:hypothetical protein
MCLYMKTFEYPGRSDRLHAELEYAVEECINARAFSVGIDAILVFKWDVQTSELAENLRGLMNHPLIDCLDDICDPRI